MGSHHVGRSGRSGGSGDCDRRAKVRPDYSYGLLAAAVVANIEMGDLGSMDYTVVAALQLTLLPVRAQMRNAARFSSATTSVGFQTVVSNMDNVDRLRPAFVRQRRCLTVQRRDDSPERVFVMWGSQPSASKAASLVAMAWQTRASNPGAVKVESSSKPSLTCRRGEGRR